MDSPSIDMAKDANAQAPHATVEIHNTQNSGETTQDCTICRGLKAAVRGAVGSAFLMLITLFIAGLVATFFMFDRNTPFYSPLFVYLTTTDAGMAIAGAVTAALALLFMAVPIHFLVRKKCAKCHCSLAAATGSSAAVESVSAAEETPLIEKPLIEV